MILQNLLVEKQLSMYFGLEQLNYKRITEYMEIAEPYVHLSRIRLIIVTFTSRIT